jgi:hypothetical protein
MTGVDDEQHMIPGAEGDLSSSRLGLRSDPTPVSMEKQEGVYEPMRSGRRELGYQMEKANLSDQSR